MRLRFTLVMRRLSAEEQKTYGMTVLKNMAKNRVRDIVYGTSILQEKSSKGEGLRICIYHKNRWGYLVLGTLAAAGLAGSSMWVFAGQIKMKVIHCGTCWQQVYTPISRFVQPWQVRSPYSRKKRGNACISCGGHGYPLLERRV